MKGLIAVIIIYALTVCICATVKILNKKVNLNKKSGENSPPKIYYVTRAKKQREKQNVIPIKASVIEKEDIVK
ncbi:MAG: hypothetical protein IJA97_00650 [Clostridia bacterium]|nr:hypothetical protein [Clostridia bacterium]